MSRRVLIADGDANARTRLAALLRERSLVVDEAADVPHASQLLSENAYAVVLIDPLLSDGSGFALLEREPARHATPVVLVISNIERGALSPAVTSRVHGLMRKPCDEQEVAAVVTACVDVSSTSTLGAMALATVIGGAPILGLLN